MYRSELSLKIRFSKRSSAGNLDTIFFWMVYTFSQNLLQEYRSYMHIGWWTLLDLFTIPDYLYKYHYQNKISLQDLFTIPTICSRYHYQTKISLKDSFTIPASCIRYHYQLSQNLFTRSIHNTAYFYMITLFIVTQN